MPRRVVVLVLAVCFLLGLGIGVLLTALYMRFAYQNSKQVFEQKIRCGQIAKSLEQSQSSPGYSFQVIRQGFSPKRNSCIAMTTQSAYSSDSETEEVVDLLTGELLWVKICKKRSDSCEQYVAEFNKAFDETQP